MLKVVGSQMGGGGGGILTQRPKTYVALCGYEQGIREAQEGHQVVGVRLQGPVEAGHRLGGGAQAELDAAGLRPRVPPPWVHGRGLGVRLQSFRFRVPWVSWAPPSG